MSLNLLRAHGSTTHYQYQYQDCRCVACRGAMSAYSATHYQDTRDARLEKSAGEYAEFHEWLRGLRLESGCEDCGTCEGYLCHHHIDPSEKRDAISQLYHHSVVVVEAELAKCVVLCMSCHRKRHLQMEAA